MYKKEIIGYQGIFFDNDVKEKLIELQQRSLNKNIDNIHVTFYYGNIERYPEEILEKDFEVKVLGYGSDGLNSGFLVEITKELSIYYKNSSVPHITISLGEINGVKGKAVDTGALKFEKLDTSFIIKGKIGYFVKNVGVIFDNSIFN